MIAPRIDESESGGSNASAYDLYAVACRRYMSFQQVPSLESSKHVLLFWCTIIEQGIRVDAPKWFRYFLYEGVVLGRGLTVIRQNPHLVTNVLASLS